jgi:P-type E1-E2 ATPase
VVTFKNRNGEGVVSTITNKQENKSYEVLCGNSKLMKHFEVLKPYPELEKNIGYLEEEGKTVVILAVDKIPNTVISLEETHLSKPEASFVVNYLQNTVGMKVCMITGDNKHSALRVARHLNIPIENVTYQAYPETKKEVVEKYQSQGRKVLFVGDGINDSPVLAQSDVGCAINSASEVTVGAAGIVLMKDSLLDVLRAIMIAGKTF